MELLLWRWSTAVQITSAIMIAVFFVFLARSVRRIELKSWVRAWAMNLFALVITITFWFYQPQSGVALWFVRFSYVFFKTSFIIFLLSGNSFFISRWWIIRNQKQILICALIFSGVCGVVLTTIPHIGILQSGFIALALGTESIFLLRQPNERLGWICTGFIARAILGAMECILYVDRVVSRPFLPENFTAISLSAHSSLDTGAEWLIALGCVLAIYHRIQKELERTNADLLNAQEELQRLADRDSLTSLSNRRALPSIFRDCYKKGATILFFDLDGFKQINDEYGHAAGDECLRTFAKALQKSFRPDDALVRYAGDEFLVIAAGAEPSAIMERVDGLKKALDEASTEGVKIKFSVGSSYLAPLGDPEAALQSADHAMYRMKPKKRAQLVR